MPSIDLFETSQSIHFFWPFIFGVSVLSALYTVVQLANDTMMIEAHKGRLYLQFNVPPQNGPALLSGSVEVTLRILLKFPLLV